MAEAKRLSLDATKSLQREKKSKEVPPTYRFELSISESTESGVEYSYAELLKNERAKEREHDNNVSDDPFSLDDDKEKLQDIVQRLEEKYNSKKGKKKKNQSVSEDYIDRGMGYDESDPFIDNEEAYDELVPSTITTEFGGFYINKGDLEFKDLSESGSAVDSKMRRKRRKQISEKDSTKKKRRLGNEENQKRRGRKPLSEFVSALPKQKKKTQPTVADMLEQYKAQLQIQQQENIQQMQLNPIAVEMEIETDNVENVPSLPQVPTVASISEAIESVVKGGDASNGSVGPVTGSSDEDMKPQIENIEAPKLPDNLPPDLDIVLAKLKEAAHKSEEGKCKFFSDEVNRMLLSVELKVQELTSAQRSTIYSHLASHLPCTKETLQKRAKKLRLDQEDGKLREPMQRLKDSIAVVMPALMEKYAVLVQACDTRDEKRQDNLPLTGSDGDDSQEGEKKASRLPKKHFEWNETIRKYLCDVVRIKLKCYEVSKTRIQSAEEYLKHFLEAEVKNLWPTGWMQARILFRESRAAHFYITNRPKKQILIPKKFVSPLSSGALSMKPAVSLLNSSVLSQESEYEPLDKCVPSIAALPLDAIIKKEILDTMPANAATDERAVEFAKLFTLPIKNSLSDDYINSKNRDSLISQVISNKFNADSPPKTSPPLLHIKTEPQVPSKIVSPIKTEKHSRKQTPYVSKVPDFNTFAEGSLASDMLSRIICASLGDFPYAGSPSPSVDNSTSKVTSVISPNPSSTKESRAINTKFPNDILASPKKHDALKMFSHDLKKSSRKTGLHLFPANNINMESLLSSHQSVNRQVESSSVLTKHKGLPTDISMPAVNLKLKDSSVPHSRQFAEAFERTVDAPVSKKHNIKGHIHLQNLAVAGGSNCLMNHANEYPSSTSPRSTIENTQKMAFDFAAKYNASLTQDTPTAPYKKRTKYAQGSKNLMPVEQWNQQFLDTGLNTSLLEGMKGFPFPIGSISTPPPAHSSTPIRTISHPQHSTARTSSHATSGHRTHQDSNAESVNQASQIHSHIPVTEGIRRQSLIQGPWKTSPTSQAPATSLAHFLSTSPPISTPINTTSQNHIVNSRLSISPAPAHSMPHIEKISAAYNHSHNHLPPRASPSHPSTLGHSLKTSPSNIFTQQLGQPIYTTHQSSHTVSSNLHARNNNSYDSANPTSPNLMMGTFTIKQEVNTMQPRTN